MKKEDFPIKSKSSAFLAAFGTSVIIYAVIIVIIGPIKGEVIPHLVDCSSQNCDFTNLGSSILEVLLGIFIAMLVYKLQKDHSEKLQKVKSDITEKIFSRNVELYTADFRFDELFDENSRDQENMAEKKVTQRATDWIDSIEKNAKHKVDIEIPGRGKGHKLELSKGILELSLPQITTSQYAEGRAKSINIHTKTENLELINDVIESSSQPYWDFQWYVKESYDVQQILARIEEKTGKTPMSKSGTGSGENTVWTQATFHIMEINNHKIGFTLSIEKISIVCYSSPPNGGFFTAHKFLNPGKIISILYGEYDIQSLRDLFGQIFKK